MSLTAIVLGALVVGLLIVSLVTIVLVLLWFKYQDRKNRIKTKGNVTVDLGR